MRHMLRNAEFRDRFLKRVAYVLDNILTDEKILARIDFYHELLKPEIARECSKWEGTVDSWEAAVQRMREYITSRDLRSEMINSLQKHLSLKADEKAKYFR